MYETFDRLATRKLNRAFTLVELLVVIAIIGVLVALLLPAIQAAREAARRTACTNNLRNVALGVLNYQDARRQYPVPIHLAPGTTTIQDVGANDSRLYGNWAIDILPFIEQQPLYNRFQVTALTPLGAAVNAAAIATPINIFRCPSDSAGEQPFTGSAGNTNWARGNYGLNAFQFFPHTDFLKLLRGESSSASTSNFLERLDFNMGISAIDGAERSDKNLTDGTTNTILVAEMRAGLSQRDRRGVWAMGMCGSNFFCRHASNLANGVNDCGPGADDINGTTDIQADVGAATLRAECMMPDSGWSYSGQSIVRSVHPGGAFAALADGSTRFISDFIDGGSVTSGAWIGETQAADVTEANFRVWQRLNMGSDGYVMTIEK